MKIGSTYNPHVITDPISPQAATAESGRVSPKKLITLITSSSKDCLMRMFKHGTSQQKQLADATINALDKGTFKSNPTTQLPVLQFGDHFNLDGELGILMANFRVEENKLELAAIGFRKQGGEFNGAPNPVVTLVLKDAQRLPEAGLLAHLHKRPPQGNSLSKFVPTQVQSEELHTAKTAKVIKLIDENSPPTERAKIITLEKKRIPKIPEHEFLPEAFDHFREESLKAFKDPTKNGTRKASGRPAAGFMNGQLIASLNKKLDKSLIKVARQEAYNKLNGDAETKSVSPKLDERSSAYNALNGATAYKPGASNIGIKRVSGKS